MKYVNNVIEALGELYRSKSYIVFTVIFGMILFTFNTLINNYKILISNFSFKLFFSLLAGTIAIMSTVSLVLLIIMSVFAGVVLSMSIFLMQRQVTGITGAGSSSLAVSLIAPACPSCAVGLLSVLGLGGFLSVLPFKGLELGVVGVALLTVSLIFLSGKIVTKTCTIKNRRR